jgi:hypothetical protein
MALDLKAVVALAAAKTARPKSRDATALAWRTGVPV